jgi:hypothetical protein
MSRTPNQGIASPAIDSVESKWTVTLQQGLAGYSHQGNEDNSIEDVHNLAAQETEKIRRWKGFLFTIMFVSGLFVATGAYILLSREEAKNYQDAVRPQRRFIKDCHSLPLTKLDASR